MSAAEHADDFRRAAQAAVFGALGDQVRRLRWSATQIAEHQRAALRSLLAHARDRSAFHAERLAGIDVERFELADLARLPVMTKSDLMSRFEAVATDRRITLEAAEEALARSALAPQLLQDRYLCLTSGGSSGRRGVFVTDMAGQAAFAGAMMRPMAARMGVGGFPPAGLTIAMVAAASPVHATGLACWMLAGSPVNFVCVPATQSIGDIVARLNALRPPILYGYTSMIAALARERLAGRLAISPSQVTVTSETLSQAQRDLIGEAFGPALANAFGATEGVVGHAAPGEDAITFASDLCIIEPVDARNRPVPPGVASHKILVTNLANHVQPLIRYEMGDRLVCEEAAAEHGHLRARVEGRSDEALAYGGVQVHPLTLRSVLLKTPEVTDYVVRQTRDGVDVTVAGDGPVDAGRLAQALSAALCAAGLRGAKATVSVVSALERLPGTGKLRRFVPLETPGSDQAG